MNERTWIEVDLDNISYNYELIKRKANGAMICPVIKDDAYGHGAVKLGLLYEKLGCDYFAVSCFDEAMELRKGGITKPILILGYTQIEYAKDLHDNNITQCVYSLDYANALNDCGQVIKCHLKVDTGMNRIGFKDVDEMEYAYNLPNLQFEGIFTHFAKATDEQFTQKQFDTLMNAIDELHKRNCDFKIRHCANSAGIFLYDKYTLDMVRPGIILYGLGGYSGLKPAMKLKSVISEIKTVKKGETIGYERNYTATKDIRVATVAIGYGDGFFRANSGKNKVCINNTNCDIVGNICMDQMMVDVSDVDCKMGDEVNCYIDFEECANNLGTISYELICAIDSRVKVNYLTFYTNYHKS